MEIKENGNLFVNDNATTILEITPFDQNNECIIIMRDPVDGDSYHYINESKAKEIILFLQEGLNKIQK